jgi:protein SCO1/2
MNPSARTFPWTVGIGLLLVVMTLALVYLLADIKSRAPHARPLMVIGTVDDFTLTNQLGVATTLADLRGHVWVADIIFTRCAGPCPRMTRQMKELQDALRPDDNAKLVTLTTDPDNDTPEVLKRYAEDRANADTNRWIFLTGTKKQIANLAIDSLKLSAVEKKPEERESDDDLFVHSTIFVVVDRKGQLRGVYETGGEGVDWTDSKRQILAAVNQLEREK